MRSYRFSFIIALGLLSCADQQGHVSQQLSSPIRAVVVELNQSGDTISPQVMVNQVDVEGRLGVLALRVRASYRGGDDSHFDHQVFRIPLSTAALQYARDGATLTIVPGALTLAYTPDARTLVVDADVVSVRDNGDAGFWLAEVDHYDLDQAGGINPCVLVHKAAMLASESNDLQLEIRVGYQNASGSHLTESFTVPLTDTNTVMLGSPFIGVEPTRLLQLAAPVGHRRVLDITAMLSAP